jgi:hypothetical protein
VYFRHCNDGLPPHADMENFTRTKMAHFKPDYIRDRAKRVFRQNYHKPIPKNPDETRYPQPVVGSEPAWIERERQKRIREQLQVKKDIAGSGKKIMSALKKLGKSPTRQSQAQEPQIRKIPLTENYINADREANKIEDGYQGFADGDDENFNPGIRPWHQPPAQGRDQSPDMNKSLSLTANDLVIDDARKGQENFAAFDGLDDEDLAQRAYQEEMGTGGRILHNKTSGHGATSAYIPTGTVKNAGSQNLSSYLATHKRMYNYRNGHKLQIGNNGF